MTKKKSQKEKISSLRQRAEHILYNQSSPLPDATTLSIEEMQHLIHELQVHQIELKTQNEELMKIQRNLEKMHNKYSDLYDFAPVGYLTFGEKSKILEANLTAASLLGIERSALIGKSLTKFITSQSQDIFYMHWQMLLKTGIRQTFELKLKKKDGTQFPAQLECIALQDTKGKLSEIRIAVSNITKRKQIEAEKKRLQLQLQQSQKMEAIGSLAGGIAHNFNNILTIILGFTELTKDEIQDNEKAKKNLDHIIYATDKAIEMVKQILTFSRQSDKNLKPLLFSKPIHEMLTLLKASIPPSIKIRAKIDKDLGPILGDFTQLQQIIMNIINNSATAMKEYGGIIELSLTEINFSPQDIDIGTLEPGRYQRLTISDTGPGMTAEIKRRIFEPYFTTKKEGEGTGMGLSVVHGIVNSHGGEIRVYSEPGKGTTFNIYLPVFGELALPESESNSEHILFGNEKILFIDNDKNLLFLVKEMLENLGYKVSGKTSSVKALEYFRKNPGKFDLLIIDMNMPKMPGIELAREIKSIRKDIPLVLCKRLGDDINEKEFKNKEFSAVVMKPIKKKKLAKTIRNLLD